MKRNTSLNTIVVLVTTLTQPMCTMAGGSGTNSDISTINPNRPNVEETTAFGDVRVSIGTKLWINSWEKFTVDAYGVTTGSTRSRTEVVPIPTMSVKYKDFFISGSYFADTGYTFNSYTGVTPSASLTRFPLQAAPGTAYNVDLTGTRSEWDVTAGYFVHPSIAFVAGYKEINQNLNSIGTVLSPTAPAPGTIGVKIKYSGPIIGLVGSAPIGNGFGVYGNFAYGFLTGDFQYVDSFSKSADYILVDGGMSYTYKFENRVAYPLASTSFFAGYRYQSIEVHNITIRGQTGTDTTQGFLAGLNLAF